MIVPAVVALVAVAGIAALAWLRSRAPDYGDDPSVLLADPPEGLTAATAAVLGGGATATAFMAALLDLASRDEIRFRREGAAGHAAAVGIEIRGGETADPRVILNRRRPIGEAEAFVLTQLQTAPFVGGLGTDPLALLAQATAGLAEYRAYVTSPGAAADDAAERERRSRGLFPADGPHPKDAPPPGMPRYIPAAQAVHLSAPLMFRTVAEQYAVRHGWLAGTSVARRAKWSAVGAAELALAVVAFLAGGRTLASPGGGVALGVATGAVITLLLAPLVPGSTRAGAVVLAQLRAYRRTVRETLALGPQGIADGGRGGLGWLETPDQLAVWAVALGLRVELEACAGAADQVGTAGADALGLSWLGDPPVGGLRAMLAGIEAVGSRPRGLVDIAS